MFLVTKTITTELHTYSADPMGLEEVSKDEDVRAASLREAETKAIEMFEEIEKSVIRSGVTEKELSDEIHKLGADRYGVRTHWHKRVIRSGPNTLAPFQENPPDRMVEEGDILYVDLGPVFEQWEADFGRTFVLGDDPAKHKIQQALEPTWYAVKERYKQNPDMTGEQLYDIASEEAEKAGSKFGAWLAGHVVGNFPHERIPNDMITLYLTKGNNTKMSSIGPNGQKRHWILEMHLHDPVGNFNGFYEQLLTVD